MLLDAQDTVQLVRPGEEVSNLYDQWTALWNEDHNATPFQSPIWLSRWHKYFAASANYAICTSGDRLIGLLPLNIIDNGARRELQLLGTGISDHQDAIFLPGNEVKLAELFWEYLLSTRAEWDEFVLHDIRVGSSLNRLAPELAVRESQQPAPALPLGGCGSLSDAIPTAQFKKLAYCRKRASRLGLTFESADSSNFEELFGAFVNLHRRRWEAKGTAGVLWDHKVREFHREVAWEFLKAGMLRLYAIRFDAHVIAVFYGFAAHGTTFYYLGGFEPDFSSLSPGLLIVGHALEEAIGDKQSCFDFLRGAEPYKYQWGARDFQKCSLTITGRSAVAAN